MIIYRISFWQFQATLGLTDADTIPVESAIIRQVQVIQFPGQALNRRDERYLVQPGQIKR
ncbi:hypothetical protein AM10699_29090 [Acaryochloris marina MBIC10699]|nr:hypothetical protein AM10699_29090 [Acaryochloris marina MBIC10699]